MSFTSWVRGLTNQVTTSFGFMPFGGSNSFKKQTETTIVQDGYLSNDVVYSVVTKTALLASRLPWKITKNGEEVNENDPVVQLLLNPNKTQTYEQYTQELFINLALLGDSYSLKEREAVGFNDLTLTPLPSQTMQAVRENPNTILSDITKYIFSDLTSDRTFDAEDIVHSILVSPTLDSKENYNGLSPLQSGYLSVRALNNANLAEAVIFENGAPQTLMVKKAGGLSLTKSDTDKLDRAAKQRLGGAGKSGSFTSVTGDVQAIKVGSTPKELGTEKSRIQQLRNICNLWGVSSSEFNDPDNKTYNNAKEGRKALYVDFVIPRMEQIMSEHAKKVFIDFGEGYKWEVKKDEIEVLNPDSVELKKHYLEEFKAGALTIEEYKEKTL